MKIDFPEPSLRAWPPSGTAREGIEAGSRSGLRRTLLAGVRRTLLLALLACGGSSEEGAVAPGACTSDDECSDGQQCIDAACGTPSPPSSMSAGPFACSVVNCPASQPDCCTAGEATATGNGSDGYANRNQMVASASSVPGEVRASFSFDAADQQGWLSFEFGTELDLDRLEITARHFGVADRFLAVNTNRSDDSGCSFGFELEPRPPPEGEGPFVLGNEVSFNGNGFCYGDGRPGRASQLAFTIFAMHPGDATLVISNITLRE